MNYPPEKSPFFVRWYKLTIPSHFCGKNDIVKQPQLGWQDDHNPHSGIPTSAAANQFFYYFPGSTTINQFQDFTWLCLKNHVPPKPSKSSKHCHHFPRYFSANLGVFAANTPFLDTPTISQSSNSSPDQPAGHENRLSLSQSALSNSGEVLHVWV